MVILLVEADVRVQEFIQNLLKSDGFAVLTAGNGDGALETSGSYPGRIDLLLYLDVPGMSAPEVRRMIAAERPEIQMLVMSGDLQAREQASMNGLPFLQKPFSPTALRDSIKALLGPIPPSQ